MSTRSARIITPSLKLRQHIQQSAYLDSDDESIGIYRFYERILKQNTIIQSWCRPQPVYETKDDYSDSDSDSESECSEESEDDDDILRMEDMLDHVHPITLGEFKRTPNYKGEDGLKLVAFYNGGQYTLMIKPSVEDRIRIQTAAAKATGVRARILADTVARMGGAVPHCAECHTTEVADLVAQQTDEAGDLVSETCWRCVCRMDGMVYE